MGRRRPAIQSRVPFQFVARIGRASLTPSSLHGLLGAARRSLAKGRASRDYAAAVASGYAQMGVGLLVQLVMVPIYLSHLGRYRFGVLMMALTFVNVAAVGVVWLSGASLRLLGEAFADEDDDAFARIYTVSRWLLVGYALLAALAVCVPLAYAVGRVIDVPPDSVDAVRGAILGAGIYLIVLYALNTDRIALIARGKQSIADVLTVVSQLVFVVTAIAVLQAGGDLPHVMGALSLGMVVALAFARVPWRRASLPFRTFVRPATEHVRIAKRMAGRLGTTYLGYGVLALALQADTLIVGWLAGPATAATFVLLWRIPEMAVNALWRIPDAMQPFIIHLDTRGHWDVIARRARVTVTTMAALGGAVAVGYAILGPAVVSLWVGSSEAPSGRWGYVLAGTAVLWLAVARVPLVFAYATVRLTAVNRAMGVELALKLALIAALIGELGPVAPPLAINLIHGLGFSWLYLRLGRLAWHRSDRPRHPRPVPGG